MIRAGRSHVSEASYVTPSKQNLRKDFAVNLGKGSHGFT